MQIFDTHPNDVGLHWICFPKFNCDDDVVNLYDSAGGTYISSAAAYPAVLLTQVSDTTHSMIGYKYLLAAV